MDSFVELVEPGLVAGVMSAAIETTDGSFLFDDVDDVAWEDHSTIMVVCDGFYFSGRIEGFGNGLSDVGAGLVEFCY